MRRLIKVLLISFTFLVLFPGEAVSQGIMDKMFGGGGVNSLLEILLVLTLLSLAPSLLIMLTSFARIVIVFSILRQGLGTQQVPPNQVIVGLSLFLTFFIMAPVWHSVESSAIKPYLNHAVDLETAYHNAMKPLRTFMLKQTRKKDIALFLDVMGAERPEGPEDIPNRVLIPAFMISELKTAFQIGFFIYIPFLIIDMVVASALLSMGMFMLPPVIISLPFKLMLFVLVDGWNLLVGSLVHSFRF